MFLSAEVCANVEWKKHAIFGSKSKTYRCCFMPFGQASTTLASTLQPLQKAAVRMFRCWLHKFQRLARRCQRIGRPACGLALRHLLGYWLNLHAAGSSVWHMVEVWVWQNNCLPSAQTWVCPRSESYNLKKWSSNMRFPSSCVNQHGRPICPGENALVAIKASFSSCFRHGFTQHRLRPSIAQAAQGFAHKK